VGFRRDECIAYTNYLIAYAKNELPNSVERSDMSLFLQSDAGDHLYWGYINLIFQALPVINQLGLSYVPLNHGRVVQALTPCKVKIFELVFGRTPTELGTYCCAQFIVSKTEMLKPRNLEKYQRMQLMLDDREAPKPACSDIPGHSTHCLMYEKMWHVLFGEPDLLPLRGENPTLPLFLR